MNTISISRLPSSPPPHGPTWASVRAVTPLLYLVCHEAFPKTPLVMTCHGHLTGFQVAKHAVYFAPNADQNKNKTNSDLFGIFRKRRVIAPFQAVPYTPYR